PQAEAEGGQGEQREGPHERLQAEQPRRLSQKIGAGAGEDEGDDRGGRGEDGGGPEVLGPSAPVGREVAGDEAPGVNGGHAPPPRAKKRRRRSRTAGVSQRARAL